MNWVCEKNSLMFYHNIYHSLFSIILMRFFCLERFRRYCFCIMWCDLPFYALICYYTNLWCIRSFSVVWPLHIVIWMTGVFFYVEGQEIRIDFVRHHFFIWREDGGERREVSFTVLRSIICRGVGDKVFSSFFREASRLFRALLGSFLLHCFVP